MIAPIDSYFESWDQQDPEYVYSIFSERASYIIVNKNRNIRGALNIKKYWERNAKRQKQLNVSRAHISICGFSLAAFHAKFIDAEEGSQAIYGVIFIMGRNLINILVELYIKVRIPSARGSK